MNSALATPWFIGCACDPGYVEHTAVLLTSIDLNGDVPNAQVIVAGFNLSGADKELLRVGAGRLASAMRIIDVGPEMLGPLGANGLDLPFPAALLGRFVVPEQVGTAIGRLLQLDSDTVVNRSLRPLFELRMYDAFLAACHDVPRTGDMNYFNAGVMLIDLAGFRSHNIAQRSLRWLAESDPLPHFLDQDALNIIVGDVWHRLDHRWNFHAHHGEPRPVTGADYEAASIAHFAAGKPWNQPGHVGRHLYERYHDELASRRRVRLAVRESIDASFVATAVELFLGREAAPGDHADAQGYTATGYIRHLLHSSEFVDHVLLRLALDQPFDNQRFVDRLALRHKRWAIERLVLEDDVADKVEAASGWRDLVGLIVNDFGFRRYAAIIRLMSLVDGVNAHMARQIETEAPPGVTTRLPLRARIRAA